MDVGVVIPCYNEAGFIAACLQSILNSDYSGGKISVAVVDGMSTDGTRDIVQRISKEHASIQLINNPKKTAPYAMNIGIKELQVEVVIILGGHSEIAANFISENVKVLREREEVVCSGGRCENIYSNETAKAIGAAMSSRFGVGDVRFRTGGEDGYVDTVAFGAYRKKVFDEVGYFDENLTRNQDDEFNYRITSSGRKIWYADAIQYRYHVRASFSKLYKQYYQYGYWKVKVNRKHKTVTTLRQVVPALFVSYLIVQALSLLVFPWAKYGLIILGLYLFLALLSAIKNYPKSPIKVFWAYLILHSSYGWGYIQGLFSSGKYGDAETSR